MNIVIVLKFTWTNEYNQILNKHADLITPDHVASGTGKVSGLQCSG